MSDELVKHLEKEMLELRKDIKKLTDKLHTLELRVIVISSMIVGGANVLTKYL